MELARRLRHGAAPCGPEPGRADQAAALHHWITSSARKQQRLRHGQAQRLGGLQVDHQLEARRLLHRQVGGPGALENAVDIGGGTAEQVAVAGAVGHQRARLRVASLFGDGRQAEVAAGARDRHVQRRGQEVAHDHHGVDLAHARIAQRALHRLRRGRRQAQAHGAQPLGADLGFGLVAPLPEHRVGGVVQHAHGGQPRHHFLQQLHALGGKLLAEVGHARDHAAGPGQAGEQVGLPAARVQADRDDGHRLGVAQDQARRRGAGRQEHLDALRQLLAQQRFSARQVAFGVVLDERPGAPFHLAQIAHAFAERGHAARVGFARGQRQVAHHWHGRLRRQPRHGQRGGETGHQPPAPDH